MNEITLTEYRRELANHDWHFERCDDARERNEGWRKHWKLREIAERGPEFKQAYTDAFEKAFPLPEPKASAPVNLGFAAP